MFRPMQFFRILILLCLAGPVWVQAADDQAMSLDQCISVALSRNPLILSSEQFHQASLARIDQATAFPYPSLDFNSDLQPQPLNFFKSRETYLGATQTFEFPGKRSLRGKIAESESREMKTDIESLRIEIAFMVKEAFYKLLLAQEMSKYAQRDLELSKDFLEKAEIRLEAGEVGRVEVLRARVESLKAANAVKVASNEESLAKARLNNILARGKNAPLEIQGQLRMPFVNLNLDELKREARSLRPESRRISFAVEREKFKQEQSRLSSRPDFDVNLSHHYVDGEPFSWSFTVSVPLPFLFKQRQNAEVMESVATVLALQRELDHLVNSISLEVEEAYLNSLTANTQIQLYQNDILPEAEEVYQMFLFSYQEGEIGGIELIEARRTLNEANRYYAEELFNYALTLAALDKAVGRDPSI